MGRGAKRPLPHPLIELVPKCVDPTCGAIAWGYSFTKAKHLSQIINGLAPKQKREKNDLFKHMPGYGTGHRPLYT